MNRDTLRDKIYLAALLHDIGKFYQRADKSGTASSELLSDSVKNSESVYCPLQQGGYYSHKHVLWTAQFIDDLGIHLKNISGKTDNSLEHLAAKHHKPSNFYEELIQMADHLSSGLDRSDLKKPPDESKTWDSFKKIRMNSVFENLMKQENTEVRDYLLPVEPMQTGEKFFPGKQFDASPDYSSLWNDFVIETKFIQTDSYHVFAESLYSLLFKYTSNVASSTINLPDVSLFDHLKTTAALSICLYDAAAANQLSVKSEIEKSEKPFLLIGGDVSGIQNYIYDILSKQAAKNLKGRSFYVQLLVDTIIQRLLNELNLYSSNVVYSSGGGFYLLAANTKEVKDKLKAINIEISEAMLQKHGTSLYLAIETEEVSIQNIKGKRINENWKKLNEKLNRKKRQRYKGALAEKYNYFFEPTGEGGQPERDAITGEDFLPQEPRISYGDKVDGNQPVIKPYTQQQIQLGKILKQADYWISSDVEMDFIDKKYSVDVCGLGVWHYFFDETTLKTNYSKIRDSKEKVRIWNINNTNFLDPSKGINNIFGFNLYGGNDYPADENGVPKSFDELAGEGNLKRLGFLRMDVDNLGAVFASGFTDEMRTFSRYSALSRSLDYFFKGYINTIWEKDRYKESTFIIYSGGDDLFLVGRWDVLIDMAEEIRDKFRQWTCYNPFLTISGGIAVVNEKFPVLKAADMAREAEEAAKEHELGEKPGWEKNAFTVLGVPLNWEEEYYWVKNLKNTVKEYFQSESLPRSFGSKVHAHFANAQIVNHEITRLNVLWLMAYDFSRMAGTLKSGNDVAGFLDKIKDWAFTNKAPGLKNSKYHVFELINLATRWAELELRTNKQ